MTTVLWGKTLNNRPSRQPVRVRRLLPHWCVPNLKPRTHTNYGVIINKPYLLCLCSWCNLVIYYTLSLTHSLSGKNISIRIPRNLVWRVLQNTKASRFSPEKKQKITFLRLKIRRIGSGFRFPSFINITKLLLTLLWQGSQDFIKTFVCKLEQCASTFSTCSCGSITRVKDKRPLSKTHSWFQKNAQLKGCNYVLGYLL